MFLLSNRRFATFEKTSFQFPVFPKISLNTRFRFQHFPEPRRNLVSVFLVIFWFFPVLSSFFSLLFLSVSRFSSFFPCFSFFVEKLCLVSSRFPFTPIPHLEYRLVSHFLSRIQSHFPFLASFSKKMVSPTPSSSYTRFVSYIQGKSFKYSSHNLK